MKRSQGVGWIVVEQDQLEPECGFYGQGQGACRVVDDVDEVTGISFTGVARIDAVGREGCGCLRRMVCGGRLPVQCAGWSGPGRG